MIQIKAAIWVTMICLLMSACKKRLNTLEVKIEEKLASAVSAYVKENKVYLRLKVVTVEMHTGDYRTDVYIANINSDLYRRDVPSYYTIVNDSIIVLVYGGFESSLDRNVKKILSEIDDVLIKYQVTLKIDPLTEYCPRTWRYISSYKGDTIIKKPHWREYEFLPYGYRLMLDSVKRDSLFVEKIVF